MSRKQGKPSGNYKPDGTGVPSNLKPENLDRDKEITDKYTNEDEDLAEHVRQKNPNRNVDKLNSTNAGGYKN